MNRITKVPSGDIVHSQKKVNLRVYYKVIFLYGVK